MRLYSLCSRITLGLPSPPLPQLCTQIEELEQENKGLKEAGGGGGSSATSNGASSSVDGELLRLQAENATLQKQMKGVLLYLPQGR